LEYSGLPVRHVKHALAVLTQYNLAHYSISKRGATTYEANVDSCYNLLRIGKIDELIGRKYGYAEQEVVRSLNAFGLVELGDLSKAFGAQSRSTTAERASPGDVNGGSGRGSGSGAASSSAIESIFHLHHVVARLVQLEILDVVDGPADFANLETVVADINTQFSKRAASAKCASAKEKLSLERETDLRVAQDRGKALKRQLDDESGFPHLKKRRLESGGVNASAHAATSSSGKRKILEVRLQSHEQTGERVGLTRPQATTILKLNYEKCLVDLRNESLVLFAQDAIGETTSKVYESLLHLVTQKISRCRSNPRTDASHGAMFDDEPQNEITVSPSEILDMLDPTVDLDAGIAKVGKDKTLDESQMDDQNESMFDTDHDAGEPQPPRQTSAGASGHRQASYVLDESDGGGNGEAEMDASDRVQQNGTRQKGVKFGNLPNAAASKSWKDYETATLRRHLMLLCTDKRGFARQHSKKGEGRFTVDFGVVMEALREAHIDAMVEATSGRFGLRLVNALKHFGKLDERALSLKTFLPKPQVEKTMAELLQAGFADVQEVPKDNSRNIDRSFCLWYCDKERISRLLPERLCEIMVRCFQVRDVEKAKVRDILDFVQRSDVKGRVEEVLDETYYRRYHAYQDKETRLLGSISRLDEIVACLRDY
jgi:DNA-directed RNA polymerase III subunit RPC3